MLVKVILSSAMTSFEADDLAQFLKEQRARYDRARMEVRSKQLVLRALIDEFNQKARIGEERREETKRRQQSFDRQRTELQLLEEETIGLKSRKRRLVYLLERTGRDNGAVFRELREEQRQLETLKKDVQKVRLQHDKTVHVLEKLRKDHRKMNQIHKKRAVERQELVKKAEKRIKAARRTRKRRRQREERRAKIAAEVAGDLSAEEEKAMKRELVAKQFQANQLEAKLKRSSKRSSELRAGEFPCNFISSYECREWRLKTFFVCLFPQGSKRSRKLRGRRMFPRLSIDS